MSKTQLLAIIEEMKQAAVDERKAPLVDCPFCGILLEKRDGIWNCPLGHFRTRNPFRAQ